MQSSSQLKRPISRDFNSFGIDMQVGSGTFGMVYLGKDKETGESLALKKIKMENETQGFPVTAIREIKILKALKHKNIVALKEIITFEGQENSESESEQRFQSGDVFMVFEYVDFDLAGLIKKCQKREIKFTENHIRSFAKQLLEGVHHMHKNNILHRDLKVYAYISIINIFSKIIFYMYI